MTNPDQIVKRLNDVSLKIAAELDGLGTACKLMNKIHNQQDISGMSAILEAILHRLKGHSTELNRVLTDWMELGNNGTGEASS